MSSYHLWDQMHTEEEKARVAKTIEGTEKLIVLCEKKRDELRKDVDEITESLFRHNFITNNSKSIIDAQAHALSLRHRINDDIAKYATRLTKVKANITNIEQQRMVFYHTNFGLKTNGGEKKILIEGHLSENRRMEHVLEIHIEFLRATDKILESYQFGVKNTISLMEILGKQ